MKSRKRRFPAVAILLMLYVLDQVVHLTPIITAIREFLLWDLGLKDIIFNPYVGPYFYLAFTLNIPRILSIVVLLVLCVLLLMKDNGIRLSFALLTYAVLMFILPRFSFHFSSYYIYRSPLFVGCLLDAFAVIILALIAFVNCEQLLSKFKLEKTANIINKFWWLPGILCLSSLVLVLIFAPYLAGGTFGRYNLTRELLVVVGYFLLGYWLKNPWAKQNLRSDDAAGDVPLYIDEAYCGLGKHIILSLFTFGIWTLIWIYRTTRFLNNAPYVEQYKPGKKLLLCMFIPFYQIYWYYKHGQRIDTYAKSKKMDTSDMATMCLILGIFIPIVANILMQDRINAICVAKEPVAEETPKQDVSTSIPEELMKYKDLLDMGAITQEEYDTKKKQLLGL